MEIIAKLDLRDKKVDIIYAEKLRIYRVISVSYYLQAYSALSGLRLNPVYIALSE